MSDTDHFGPDTTHQALLKATLALDRIARHEETCGRRWSTVVRLMTFTLAQIMALVAFLLADKLGWLS